MKEKYPDFNIEEGRFNDLCYDRQTIVKLAKWYVYTFIKFQLI